MSLYSIRKRAGHQLQQRQLTNRDFTLVSNDCWGAEVYKYFNLPWNTPFIGLFLTADDYLRLVTNLRHYMKSELTFISESRHEAVRELRQRKPYPVGLLGGEVEVQFLHYHSQEEAAEKWARRTARMNWDNLVVKFDASKDGATTAHAQQFDKLPYRRLTLLKEPIPGLASGVVVKQYTPDGLEQFKASILNFDLPTWLNTGRVESGSFYQLARKVFVLEP
jgi:uncharacterized protein (DUF1919 family)